MIANQGKVLFLILLTLVVGLLVNGCAKPGGSAPSKSEQVAVVNGEVLARKDFDQLLQQSKASFEQQHGIDFTEQENKEMLSEIEKMALDEMIDETLLLQQAAKNGIAPTKAEVQAEIASIRAIFPEEAQFQQALQDSDLTLEQLEQDIMKQLKVDKLLQQTLSKDQLSVSEEEITTFYNQYKTDMEQNSEEKAPQLAELKQQIEEMLLQQKLDDAKYTLLDKLRNESEIKTNL